MKPKCILFLASLFALGVNAGDFGPVGGTGGREWRVTANDDESIVELRVGAVDRVDSIAVAIGSPSGDKFRQAADNRFGGKGGKENQFRLGDGECLTEVHGTTSIARNKRSTESVFSIYFVTSKGRRSGTYGVESGGKQFHLVAEPGKEINGLFGRAGDELDGIGVITRDKRHCK